MPEKITDEHILEYIDHVAADVDASMKKLLEDDELTAVYELISYQHNTGGKRLRPVLAVLISETFGGDYQQTVDMATTCELLHNASLVYDDVLDADILRRGKPSAHSLFGAGTAMMGGNVLILMAFRLGTLRGLPLIKMLIETSTYLALGSAEEQLFHEYDEERYMRVIGLKTASLFQAPCQVGALMAGAMRPQYDTAKKYGWHIGMLYQLTDDLVDVLKTFQEQKLTGHMKNGLPTLPFIHCFYNTDNKIAKKLLTKFLEKPPISMEEFNIIYHTIEETESIDYTMERIEKQNRDCQELCLKMPESQARNYLMAMPGFLHRTLISEVKGHEGFEGMRKDETPETATEDE